MLVTVLSLAPSILVMVTSFTRIVIVLSFLRTAIGLQQTPPNSVLVGLALFLTLFVMSPTLEAVYRDGLEPLLAEEIDESEALTRAAVPVRSSCYARCGRGRGAVRRDRPPRACAAGGRDAVSRAPAGLHDQRAAARSRSAS